LSDQVDGEWQTELLPAFEPAPAGTRQVSPGALARSEYWLRRAQPVVIPTETVYGLAAPALDRSAVEAIFRIKGRPLDNPLIAHVSGLAQLPSLGAQPTRLALELAGAFWPGPLTLVIATNAVLPWVTAGLDSIAVRQPAHPFAAALIERTGPLAAPSANLSGLPSPTRANHAAADLGGRVPLIIDGGDLEHGVESTVLDVRGDRALLLRPGALSIEAIERQLGATLELPRAGGPVRSPGMKYRHYSPRAELWLYPAPADEAAAAGSAVSAQLAADARRLRSAGRRVAAIAQSPLEVDRYLPLPADPRGFARQLFSWLRELDELGIDCVLVEGVSPRGIGRAIMDRLRRAASQVREPEAATAEKASAT
jgi:L-threonylcarbamoyladenylate synthase